MTLPARKRMRMSGFDYSSSNYYFVTICTHQKKHLFGQPNQLNSSGQIVERILDDLPSHFNNAQADAYVVMPNHVHLIIALSSPDLHDANHSSPSLSTIVGSIKSAVSRAIHAESCSSETIWQKSFYDHIIRTEKAYNEICQYIQDNPANWLQDELYCI